MHELSLAGAILSLVEQAAAREGFVRVKQLQLSCGRLAGVEVSALRFGLQAVAQGTVLEGAEVHIDEPPGQGRCLACERPVQVHQRGLACPHCGDGPVQVHGGDRLQVVALIVHDAGGDSPAQAGLGNAV